MKRIAVWVIAVMFLAGATPMFALDEDKGGPNPNKEAYEHANEHARFKRTEGSEDKEVVKSEKEVKKEAQKAEREEEKVKREAEKASRKSGKEAKKKQKEMKRESRKAGKGKGFGK
jgi:hypothetical protein